MIRFSKVKWKNFLSTGDYWNELNLDSSHKTLIVGRNGHGKSTLNDAISFGLFGKPYRPINKPQLVNSINGKKLEVHIEFTIGSNDYYIIRGLKPNKLQIYKNEELINQESSIGEYQKYLETNILRFNQKTFNQIVILSSSSYVPFMRLAAHHRREIIGDLLDVNVFNIMHDLAKKDLQYIRTEVEENDRDILEKERMVSNTQDIIEDLKSKQDSDSETINEEITQLKTELNDKKEQIVKATTNLKADQKDYDDLIKQTGFERPEEALFEFKQQKNNTDSDIKRVTKEIKFFKDNNKCPTCKQSIDINNHKHHLLELKDEYDHLVDKRMGLLKSIEDLDPLVQKIKHYGGRPTEHDHGLDYMARELMNIKKSIDKLESSKKSSANSKLIDKYETKLKDDKTDLKELRTKKKELLEERRYQSTIADILKDNGLKSKIINEYIPTLNKFINYYLDVLDFFISFNLDETFTEQIRSRYRDDFTYESFSEGEKTRIDLSILFAFRQIAKVKNAISTNLLILDEVVDSSLDTDGIENLMKILGGIDEDNNVFIISHKTDTVMDKFQNVVEFRKEGNFSRMVEE